MSCVSGSVRSRLEGQLELGALPTETVSRDHSHEAWCELGRLGKRMLVWFGHKLTLGESFTCEGLRFLSCAWE